MKRRKLSLQQIGSRELSLKTTKKKGNVKLIEPISKSIDMNQQ